MTTCAAAAERWFPVVPDPAAAVRLYCFPYAGGGPQAFQAWRGLLPAEVACVPVRLPGRETRLGEPPFTRLGPLVASLVAALEEGLEPPYALYGHSMGAIVAFELARALRRAGAEPPLGLIVSGRPAPLLRCADRRIHTLSDADLARELRALGGLPDAIAAHPELIAFFLPLLRADLEVNEDYVHDEEPPLDCPLTALAGAGDPRVRVEDVAAWRPHTTAAFRFERIAGGHFFPFEAPARTLSLVAAELARWGRGAR